GIDPVKLRWLHEVLGVMGLGTGIEIEAAGPAAERASPADIRKIGDAYDAIDRAIRRGDSAVDQDFAFHCQIAAATGNPQFTHFLEYLGRFIIPRQTLQVSGGAPAEPRSYLQA